MLASPMLAMWFLSGAAIAQVTLPEQTSEPEAPQFEPLSPAVPPQAVPPRSTPEPLPLRSNPGITSYIIGPGDQLGVAVIDFEEFTQDQIVLPDGTISLPLVGPVMASGKTLEVLQAEITQRLSNFLVEPVVEVELLSLRPVVVIVGGAVNRPGPVQLDSLTASSTPPTLSRALADAGGVRRTADLRAITVQRLQPNGRQETLTVNLWESIFQGLRGDDSALQDGDIVFVPEAPEGAEIDPQLVARSSLAPERIVVRIIGEVGSSGEISVSPDSTVLSAIASAGGHTSDANLKKVSLLRLDESGQVLGQNLDLRDFEDTTPIQNGDIVVVPKRGYLNVLDNISRTLRPVTAPFNFLFLLENFGGLFGGDSNN